jgi:hypothetical protein
VKRVVGKPRPKVAKPKWIALPQLAGLQPLDHRLVPPLPQDRPLRVLELFAGVGTGNQALARLGYHIGEVIACEARGAARVVHAHSLAELAAEFPATVAKGAGAQLHHKMPQDIRLVSARHLQELGPVDLVVAGWPCQGSSAAGSGQGLDDERSGLLTELARVLSELQALHRTWGRPLGYLIEHVAAGGDKRPRVREHFEAVRGIWGQNWCWKRSWAHVPTGCGHGGRTRRGWRCCERRWRHRQDLLTFLFIRCSDPGGVLGRPSQPGSILGQGLRSQGSPGGPSTHL